MLTRTLHRTARVSAIPRPRPLFGGRTLATRVDWRRRPTAFKASDGQQFVLLAVRKSCCHKCRFGTRWQTLWGSDSGEPVRITWCESCFNAGYSPAALTALQQNHWEKLHERIRMGSPVQYGQGARRIVAGLQRRGLL